MKKSKTACTGILAFAIAGMLALAGCSGAGDQHVEPAGANASSADSTSSEAPEIDIASMDFDYSNRDKDSSYTQESATKIILNGDSIQVQGSGVTVEGAQASINQPGTFIVSGNLSNGCVKVNLSGEEDKAQIVLADASIHNNVGPAINVEQADKVFLTLAKGTKNTLSDGESYSLAEGDDEPYATLFSKDDLCINGEGSLSVEGKYRHGIASKDDLIIYGSNISVVAKEDALRGNDCIKIGAGIIEATAGADGLKTNNTEDADLGFVTCDGATISITAEDDCIDTTKYVRITAGTITLNSNDDAIHSDSHARIAGGELNIDAQDDAIHAEFELVVDDGAINVNSSNEGFEAEKIYINGGTSNVTSSDDGLNAAKGGASSTSAPADKTLSTSTNVPENPSTEFKRGERPNKTADNTGAQDFQRGSKPETPQDEGSGTVVESNKELVAGGMRGGSKGGMGGSEDCLLQINGGTLTVNAGGDGLDSNGSIEIKGGSVFISGSTRSDNTAIDAENSAVISGGEVIAVGAQSMGRGMEAEVTSEGTALLKENINGAEGAKIEVQDALGNVLVNYTAPKNFSSITATCTNAAKIVVK